MEMEFPKSVADQIGYYVYILSDPETTEVFYIGKGTGDRMFAHEKDANENPRENDKLQRIRDIKAKGYEVKYEVLRHGLTEKEALEVEAATIDYAGLPNLANENVGHDALNRGRMTIPAIIEPVP